MSVTTCSNDVQHTFFEMIFPKRPLDFRAQFLVQWIFPIDAVIQPVQNISADVHFSPAQHLTSACLSNDLQMIRLDFLPQLFQVTHERGSADIHLIGEVVREHRAVRRASACRTDNPCGCAKNS